MPAVLDGAEATFRELQRRLAGLLPTSGTMPGGDTLLEFASPNAEPPRLIDAAVIESGGMRAHRVFGAADVGFAAFLDGTQRSRVLGYDRGIPIVHGTVAAVVRERRNRRLVTWRRPLLRRAAYAPLELLSPTWRDALERSGASVRDTSASAEGAVVHPFALRDAAIHLVQRDRERAEQELAEEWCGFENRPLFIDGGISGSERVAVSACTVGVVKSHRTLYAEGVALETVLGLRVGERSSVFRITSPKRVTVASWYLRMRDPAGHDPMWGLVRAEIAHPLRIEESAVGERADTVSRWILAETVPLALPDGRWDKMVYGVRDCEEVLRSLGA
jgi:hypothetical protein